MFGKKSQPVHVVVTPGRWYAYGPPHALRTLSEYFALLSNGGISDSVKPGYYLYDVKRRGLKLIASPTHK